MDLVGAAKLKNHGEIAVKGLNHSVYDDDESVKFPPADPATRSSAKEDTANPKISEAVKRDHWILDNNSLVFTSRCKKHCSRQQE